jgi:hypothetical protein
MGVLVEGCAGDTWSDERSSSAAGGPPEVTPERLMARAFGTARERQETSGGHV